MANPEVTSTFLLVLRLGFTVGIVQYPEANIILRHAETKLCLGILNVPNDDPLKYTGKEEVGLTECSKDSKAQRFYEHCGNDDEVELTTMLSDTPKKCLGVGDGKSNIAQHDCGEFPDGLLHLKKVKGLDTKFVIKEPDNFLCMKPASDKVSIERAVCDDNDKQQYFERCKGSADNCDMVWLDKNIIFRNDKLKKCLSINLVYTDWEDVGLMNCTNELTQRFYELPGNVGDRDYRRYVSMIHDNFTLCIGLTGRTHVTQMDCDAWDDEALLKLDHRIENPGRDKFLIHEGRDEYCVKPLYSNQENPNWPVHQLEPGDLWNCHHTEDPNFFKCKNDFVDCGAPWLDKNIIFRHIIVGGCLGVEYDEEAKKLEVAVLECKNDPSQRFYQLPGESEDSFQYAHMSQNGVEMCLGVTECSSTMELLKCNGGKATSLRLRPSARDYFAFHETASELYDCCLILQEEGLYMKGGGGECKLTSDKYFRKCHGDFNKCKFDDSLM